MKTAGLIHSRLLERGSQTTKAIPIALALGLVVAFSGRLMAQPAADESAAGEKTAIGADTFDPPLDIGIVLYDGVEPLDLFGPLEMWMNAGPALIKVHLIAEEKRPITITTTGYPAELAPKVEAQCSFEDAPPLDVLVVPGGIGTLREVDNERFIAWIAARSAQARVTASVCTGAALLAKAGILNGEKATGNPQ